ncbi:MAG: FMN-binding protein [Spirochaetes bacterium]|nr:FMN-binding protein [Spirochaetota bacterium]
MKKMIIVLFVVCILSGLFLSIAYTNFIDKINLNSKKALENALKIVLPEATKFQKLNSENLEIYKGLTDDNNIVGYAIYCFGGGYQDNIYILFSINKELDKILDIFILDQKETPGLGAKIIDKEFRDQFKDLSTEKEITYVKNQKPDKSMNQIEAISGATISSKSVVKILNSTLKVAKEIIIKSNN